MKRLTVAAAALSLLALGSLYAGVAGACEGYDKMKYTSAEPQSDAEGKIASLVAPSSVPSAPETATTSQPAEPTTAQ